MDYPLHVNGQVRNASADPNTPLLYVLRGQLGLVSPRFGCGQGLCGACRVQADGVVINSCDTPMWSVGDRHITTLEYLAETEHPVIAAMEAEQAAQCGYCLSGIVVTAAALIDSGQATDDTAVRAGLDGCLCRCGAHNRMVRAVLRAAQ